MAKYDGKKRTLIGDNGAIEKPDTLSIIVISISNIVVIILLYLAVRAYIG